MKIYVRNDINYDDNTPLGKAEHYTNHLLLEKTKYKLMWELRHIENEINSEGGIILIDFVKRGAEITGFSEELTDKIHKIITSSKD